MRRVVLLLTALVTLAAVAPAAAATVNVAITRVAFVPNPARIAVGDTVMWTNSDTRNRQVVSQQAGFSSPILEPGESFSFVFRRAGSFAYRDPLVQRNGMVIVEAGTPPPPPAPAGTVTIAASRTTLVFGGSVTLSGELSTGAPNETIEILAQPFGTATPAKVAEVRTTAGGEWSAGVRPRIQTTYRARWRTTTSGRVTIRVRPRIGFGVVSVARGVFTTRATSLRSYAGRFVFFQRRNALGQWVSLKRIRLGPASTARFTARLPRGNSRVRVYMTPLTAGPGYLAGISAARLIRR